MTDSYDTTSVDRCAKSVLLELGLPIHYYMKVAQAGIRCVRDLRIGTLPFVASVLLPIDEFNEATIPLDMIDWIRVGYRVQKRIVPLGNNQNYNRLPNEGLDENGDTVQVPYSESNNYGIGLQPSLNNLVFGQGMNNYAEATGGMYGLGEPDRIDNFKFIPERGRIAVGTIAQRIEGEIYLEYVAYDQTKYYSGIPIIAEPYIEQYMKYSLAKYDRNNYRVADINLEERKLYAEKKKLRSRTLPNLNKEDLLRTFRKSYKQSVKG